MFKIFIGIFLFQSVSFAEFYPKDPDKFSSKIHRHVKFHVKKKPQVYYLKDKHDLDQSRIYKALIKEIKQQDSLVNCLFVEQPFNFMQRAIDMYIETGDYSFVSDAVDRTHETYKTSPYLEADQQRQAYLSTARNLGLKVFAVDELPSVDDVKSLAKMYAEAFNKIDYIKAKIQEVTLFGTVRNKIMASRQNELFKNGQCTKAISINGLSHLTVGLYKNELSIDYIALQIEALKKYNIPFRVLQSM